MKKSKLVIMCSFLLLVSLISIGCGKTKYNASDKALSCANQAIKAGHQYMDGDRSADEVKNTLEHLCATMSYAKDYTYDEKSDDDEKYADADLQFYISHLSTDIVLDTGISADTDSFDDVKETVKKLEQLVDEYD